MRLKMLVLLVALLFAFMVPAAFAEQATDPQPPPAVTETAASGSPPAAQPTPQYSSQTNMPIRAVSPNEFVGRVNRMVGGLNTAIGGLIIPLATLSILISIAALAFGALLGSGMVKRYGWGGLFFSAIALIIFWGIPVFIGLIRSLAASFTS